MELDATLATQALQAWRDLLTNTPLSYPEFGRPEWAFADARPVLAYRVRGHTCYVFAFERPFNGSSGFVLNADRLHCQPIYGGSREALAAALSIVTTWPRPTRANGRREV